jgi:hypothetical protein
MLAWSGAKSLLEAHGRLEETRDGGGGVRRQGTVSLKGNHLLDVRPIRGARANWEVQQIRGFTARPATAWRAGLTLPVTDDVGVKFYAERNAVFALGANRSPWIYAFRIERSLHVPMIRQPGTDGFVFRDLNSNGKRDAGEPGVDGAIVKRGGQTAVTNAAGHYRVAGDARRPVVLDEASLPLGWVRLAVGSGDIPVGSHASAEFRFVIPSIVSLETGEINLSRVRLIARAQSGKEWIARMSGPLVATFDALPPGSYAMELDLSGLSEPLAARFPLPHLITKEGEPSITTVILDARPIKMWRPES